MENINGIYGKLLETEPVFFLFPGTFCMLETGWSCTTLYTLLK